MELIIPLLFDKTPKDVKDRHDVMKNLDTGFKASDIARAKFYSSIEHPIIDGKPFYQYCGDSAGVIDGRAQRFLAHALSLPSEHKVSGGGSRTYHWIADAQASKYMYTIETNYFPHTTVGDKEMPFGCIRVWIDYNTNHHLDFYRLGNRYYLKAYNDGRNQSQKDHGIVGDINQGMESTQLVLNTMLAKLSEAMLQRPKDPLARPEGQKINEFLLRPLQAIIYPPQQGGK